MTWTRAPVEALSSVTELPSKFATQTWVPSEAMATGSENPYLEAEMTWTRAPVEALSSVTELP